MLAFFEMTTFEGWSLMMFEATNAVDENVVMQEHYRDWV
jgi:hypothetical protein